MRIRVGGALSDRHASDARYYVDCKLKLMCPGSVDAAARATASISANDLIDLDFEYLVNVMMANKSRIWNSVELHDLYSKEANVKLSRRSLMQTIR